MLTGPEAVAEIQDSRCPLGHGGLVPESFGYCETCGAAWSTALDGRWIQIDTVVETETGQKVRVLTVPAEHADPTLMAARLTEGEGATYSGTFLRGTTQGIAAGLAAFTAPPCTEWKPRP